MRRSEKILSLLLAMVMAVGVCGCNRESHILKIYGDSITWYDGNDLPDSTRCTGYQQIVRKSFDFDGLSNNSWCGRTMARGTPYSSMVTDIRNEDDGEGNDNAALCIIFLGTNDYRQNVPLGSVAEERGDYDEYTFAGAYQSVIDYLLADNPDLQIVLLTPIQRGDEGHDINTPNENGNYLAEYAEMVEQIGNYYNLPVIDLYHNCGITLENIGDYTVDGLHPNNAGHELIGNYVTECLSALIEEGVIAIP